MITSKAIVLNLLNYNDSSFILDTYTEEWGRKSFFLRGYSGKRKKQLLCLQPFALISVTISNENPRNLTPVFTFSSNITLFSILSRIEKTSMVLFLSEIIRQVLKEEEPNVELFSFFYQSVIDFENLETGFSNYHLWFLLRFSKYLGFYPINNYSDNFKYFSLVNGFFVENHNVQKGILDLEQSSLFHYFLCTSYSTAEQPILSRLQRQNLISFVISYYRIHCDLQFEIKSLEVLKSVFT